jgi:hypothetical protein
MYDIHAGLLHYWNLSAFEVLEVLFHNLLQMRE